MLHFFIGTKAELIKMAPLMLELTARGQQYRYIDSGQHAALTARLRARFGLPEPDVVLGASEHSVATSWQAARWMAAIVRHLGRRCRALREKVFCGEAGICLVHGDTASTLLGCLLARRAGLKVAHIEAGLRSRSIWSPFPEELIRIACMRMADFLFCPSPQAMENVRRMGLAGKAYLLPANTALDALHLAERLGRTEDAPAEAYALATCHRFETITSKRRLAKVLEMLRLVAERLFVVFVQHEPTRHAVERWGLGHLLASERIRVLPPQDYFDFVRLTKGAELVLTDGGSIQEECYYLGKPCLLLRERTERMEGLGQNAVLVAYDQDRLRRVIQNYRKLERPRVEARSPSAVLADHLTRFDAEFPSE